MGLRTSASVVSTRVRLIVKRAAKWLLYRIENLKDDELVISLILPPTDTAATRTECSAKGSKRSTVDSSLTPKRPRLASSERVLVSIQYWILVAVQY